MRSAGRLQRCLLVGDDRKWRAERQTDAIETGTRDEWEGDHSGVKVHIYLLSMC
jgi:hypothetical protein